MENHFPLDYIKIASFYVCETKEDESKLPLYIVADI